MVLEKKILKFCQSFILLFVNGEALYLYKLDFYNIIGKFCFKSWKVHPLQIQFLNLFFFFFSLPPPPSPALTSYVYRSIYPQNALSRFLKFRQWVFAFSLLFSLGKRGGPSFGQTWILFTQGCFVSFASLIEIGQVVLEKKIFRFRQWVFVIS